MAFVHRPSTTRTVEVSRPSADRIAVNGALTFETARQAYEAGMRLLRDVASNGEPLQVDLGGVTASDSAGLAVLIEWVAAARRNGRAVRVLNVPGGIAASARISEVDQILGFAPDRSRAT